MKVLLIDDHPLILSALQTIIEGLAENVKVVATSSAAFARETLAGESDFDLALLDLRLADADGFEVLAEFRASYPSMPIVVLSASDRASDVIRSIDLGAMGFVQKRASTETLIDALGMVMAGGIYVPPMDMGSRAGAVDNNAPSSASARSVRQAATDSGFQVHLPLESLGLTPRQREVLALLLHGKPNKLIARDLKLSVETVKDHVAAVLRALNVTSRTQAVLAVGQMSQQANAQGNRRAASS
jgi:DNA-binding NarL/FixJ family response regulator